MNVEHLQISVDDELDVAQVFLLLLSIRNAAFWDGISC